MMTFYYQHILSICLVVILTTTEIQCDIPSNCTFDDAKGVWEFQVDRAWPECQHNFSATFRRRVKLMYPQKAVDDLGTEGEWTLVYNQGFEVTISHRKWFMFFDYDTTKNQSLCRQGMLGSTHDTLNRQWFCFKARKVTPNNVTNNHPLAKQYQPKHAENVPMKANHELVRKINAMQNSWKAVHYEEHEKLTRLDMQRRQGGFRSIGQKRPKLPKVQGQSVPPKLSKAVNDLPESFDWRHPPNGGPSPVSPVRNQEACGSCYAFASAGMLESRVRLATNFTEQPILSPQDVVECNPYSQGCEGGFAYLTAGKYSEDYGMVLEECNPYKGVDSPQCTTKENCTRYYATDYKYVGGYYGGGNEYLMKLELVEHGPFAVGFEAYPDFSSYKSGVYHHTFLSDEVNKFNPFELTNHAVLVVGYGVDNTTQEHYWTVKNSWGSTWGEDGFFRIRRGTDECGIESIALSIDPVL